MSIGARLQRQYLRLHQAVYELTDGRIGHRMVGSPSLLLHTTGRRSGRRRTSALIYALDGRDDVVVASNWGQQSDPAWLLNVRANPSVEVQVARRREPATARVVEADDPEYARLWAIANRSNHDRYTGYQARTSRRIPIVVLAPVDERP
jgi:deazaflavin-dependent oxidoreductase (nitroreductase family)